MTSKGLPSRKRSRDDSSSGSNKRSTSARELVDRGMKSARESADGVFGQEHGCSVVCLRKGMVILKGFLPKYEQADLAVREILRERKGDGVRERARRRQKILLRTGVAVEIDLTAVTLYSHVYGPITLLVSLSRSLTVGRCYCLGNRGVFNKPSLSNMEPLEEPVPVFGGVPCLEVIFYKTSTPCGPAASGGHNFTTPGRRKPHPPSGYEWFIFIALSRRPKPKATRPDTAAVLPESEAVLQHAGS